MKAALITCLSVILVVVLVIGNIHWNLKESSPLSTISDSDSNDSESYFSLDYYMGFAANWPEEAKVQLEAKLQDKKAFHIVLLGSEAIGDEDLGLISSLEEELADAYDTYVKIESLVYDGTSSDYVENKEVDTLIATNADMVIFEPFTRTDNNVVDMYTSVTNIETIMNDTKEELADVTFVLQPPNQIYGANLYPMQVNELQTFAEEEGIPYLNHWEAWPAGDDEAVLEYLDDDSNPNEEGYELWSNYMTDFLIAD